MTTLVTICVISYNSEKTIIETLDSVKKQDYDNIELIISDDASKDNTINLVHTWLNDNQTSFSSVEFVTSTKNTGTALNLNRGIRISHGEWIKIIAGDDLLTANCISTFLETASNNTDCDFFCCDLQPFSTTSEVSIKTQKALSAFYDTLYEPYEYKKEKNIYSYSIMGPGFFFSRKLYDIVNGFDERFPLYEEWPFVYKVINNGFDIKPVNSKLVMYRVSNFSLSGNTKSNSAKLLLKSKKDFFLNVRKPEMIKRKMYMRIWQEIIRFKVQTIQSNTSNRFIEKASYLLYFLSPRHYLEFLKYFFTMFSGESK